MSRLDYINRTYGLNVRRGTRVVARGRNGVVTSARGAYVNIRCDGAKLAKPYHPTAHVKYLPDDEPREKTR